MGKIMKAYCGGNGCVRVVDVLIKDIIFSRLPTHHLVYLYRKFSSGEDVQASDA